ncbi:MAG TPA: protein kinase [Bryobacteraceae bacterium]|nr:protein kinase [Bryobacteraceae bacterium]
MPLSPGEKLGPYEIVSLIGKGGMGEVYRAHDVRLDRDVAVKISAEQFSERFEREARAIAALNHPHICHLYDVGPNYLVMEYINGAPLKLPLRLDQALKYAAQICDALDAAHTIGITHRDLKPSNILLTKTGIKLLDFGLAKRGRSNTNQAINLAPDATLTMALTGRNEIVGTLHYMSPEQLQAQGAGDEIDGRSDIFSFGLVLYEMLTGKRAFEGSSPASVIAAIVERPAPSISDIAPPLLDRVLARCLQKDREERWQSARDIKAALDLIALEPAENQIAESSSHKKWIWPAAAAAAVGAAFLIGAQVTRQRPQTPRQTVRFQIPVQPATGLRPIAAIAPDGRSLAYFDTFPDGHTAIKIRALDSGAITELPTAEMSQPTYTFWSRDSKTIFYGSRRFLRQLDVARGAVKQICECPSDSGTVNQDGVVLLGASPGNPEMKRISPTGQVTTLRKAADAQSLPYTPQFLPDGKRFLFVEGSGVFLTSLDDPQKVKRLGDGQNRLTLIPDSGDPDSRDQAKRAFLVFSSPTGTDAVPFDAEKGVITGASVTLPLGNSDQSLVSSASNTGILLNFQVERHQVAIWFDRQGKQLGEAATTGGYVSLDLSHDGGRLAMISDSKFLIRDLDRGTTTKLAQRISAEGSSIWSPDGKYLVFTARDTNRVQHLYRAEANNMQPESVLLDEEGLHWPKDWSRDGKYLLYGFDQGKTYRDLWALPMDQPGAKPFQVTHGNSMIKQGSFSPDGRFIAYTSDESGRYEVYVQPFPDASKGKWLISQMDGVEPQWSHDGRELFFFSGQKLMKVEVDLHGGSFHASVPKELFSAPVPPGYSNDSHRWQLSPDGKRFLVMIPPSGSAIAYLDVIVNWESLLKQ